MPGILPFGRIRFSCRQLEFAESLRVTGLTGVRKGTLLGGNGRRKMYRVLYYQETGFQP